MFLFPVPLIAVGGSGVVAGAIYIDPTAGVNGSGTFASPKNTWSGLTLSGANTFLQKAGTTYAGSLTTVGAGASSTNRLVFGSYDPLTGAQIVNGSQRAAINGAGTQNVIRVSHSNVTINSLEVYGANLNASLNRGIYNDTDATSNFTVTYCLVRDIDGGDGANIYVFNNTTEISYNTITNCGGDGIFILGTGINIHHNNISATSLDGVVGDCIQVSDDATRDSSNPYVGYNTLDQTTTQVKQCILVNRAGGSSTGGIVEFNDLIGYPNGTSFGSWCLGIGFPNMVIQGNRLRNASRGIDILATATNATITGNIITNDYAFNSMMGINAAGNGNTSAKIYNNVIVNNNGGFTFTTQGIQGGSTDTIKNNIIVGWKTGISGASFTATHNDFYLNQTNGSAGTGTITTNPQFVSSTNFHLQVGSGAIGTGTNPGVTVITFDNVTMSTPFDMGSYWESEGAPAFDADTDAWETAVIGNGGTVSGTRKQLVDDLIVGLKADGVWTKLDRLWLFAAENEEAAEVDLIANTVATPNSSPTFTPDEGYNGNASSSYVDVNFNPQVGGYNYGANAACFGVWGNSTNKGVILGGSAGSALTYITTQWFNNSDEYYRINSDGEELATVISAVRGLYVADRDSSTTSTFYKDGVSLGTTADNVTFSYTSIITFYVNRVDVFYTDAQCSALFTGGTLSSGEHSDLYDRLRTYMTALGIP